MLIILNEHGAPTDPLAKVSIFRYNQGAPTDPKMFTSSFIENIQFAIQKDILWASRNVMEWLNVKKCTEEEGRKRQKYKKLLATKGLRWHFRRLSCCMAALCHRPVFSFIRREFCIHCLPPSLNNTFQFAQSLHVTQPGWVSYRLFFHKPTIFSYEHCPCVSTFSESRIIIYTNNKVTYI